MNELTPLITNEQLKTLLARAKGMSKANSDTMWEALVFVRGIYERERAAQAAVPIDDNFPVITDDLRCSNCGVRLDYSESSD